MFLSQSHTSKSYSFLCMVPAVYIYYSWYFPSWKKKKLIEVKKKRKTKTEAGKCRAMKGRKQNHMGCECMNQNC